MTFIENPATRTGMASWLGRLRPRYTRADGSAVAASFYVPKPEAYECDFLMCMLDDAENGEHYFGPTK